MPVHWFMQILSPTNDFLVAIWFDDDKMNLEYTVQQMEGGSAKLPERVRWSKPVEGPGGSVACSIT